MNKKQTTVVLILAIFLISINLRPGITSIGPILEVIREGLQLSNAQVTLLTSIPVISMGVFALLSPYFNRVFGIKKTIFAMLSLILVMTLMRGFITSYTVLVISALLIGIAIAVIGPLLSTMIKQNFPKQTATVIGVYSFGMGVGSAASAGLTAYFYESTNSFAFALSIWSVLVVFALIIWAFAWKLPLEVKQMTKEQNRKVEEIVRSPWKTPKAWLFLLFFGLQSSAFFSIITWLAPIATSSGMTLLQAGSLLSLMTTVQIFLNILLPIAMDRYLTRRFWLLLMLFAGTSAIFLFWSGNHSLMWIGAVLMGIPLGGLFPMALLFPLDEAKNTLEATHWTAMMQTGGFVMGGILPLLIAFLYDWTKNHQYTMMTMLILYIGMFAISFFVSGSKKTIEKVT